MVIKNLRLVVTDTGGLETPHYVEDYTIKGEDRWGWSFHLSLREEGTYLSLWDDDKKKIQNMHCHVQPLPKAYKAIIEPQKA